MSQLHGCPTRSKTSEGATRTDTTSSCNFPEEISLRNDLVGNFHDFRDEIFNMKNIIIKNLQYKNAKLKKTNCKLTTQSYNF